MLQVHWTDAMRTTAAAQRAGSRHFGGVNADAVTGFSARMPYILFCAGAPDTAGG
jgi:hypothetical protein